MEDLDLELGQATIVYEDPDEGRVSETVDNEKVMYARDHWVVVAGTDDQGNDLMRHIPRSRVHFVRRNVEQFEEEVATVRHRVESIAENLRDRLPIAPGGDDRPHGERPPSDSTTVQIETGEHEHEKEREEGGEAAESS